MNILGSSQQVVGQISQVKHQLDSRLEIGSGYEMEVAEYELGFQRIFCRILKILWPWLKSDENKMVILIGDYTSREAMRYHRKTFEMLNFSITEIYFEDFTEDEIKVQFQTEKIQNNILENFGKATANFL